jgi:hypothetical protein
MTKAINKEYTGILALQLIKGAIRIVMRRSFQLDIVLADITPGMAQAKLDIRGTILLPLSPRGRIIRSIIKTTRDKYPVSSRMAIKKNNKAIWGININTPPIPGRIP